MRWSSFALGFLIIALLHYAKSRLLNYWIPIEFSFFLIFFIIRSSGTSRALIMTFLLSLGLDILFQSAQVKGLEAMGQTALVFAIMNIKKNVAPFYEDFILIAFFALFCLANYYIGLGLSALFGVYYQSLTVPKLLFFTLVHTILFSLALMVAIRFRRNER